MAADKGQKTEKPTPKRVKEAHKEGRFAKSPDIGSWFSLTMLIFLFPVLLSRSAGLIVNFLASSFSAMAYASPSQVVGILGKGLYTILDAAFLPVLLIAVAGTVSSLAQTGLKFSTGALGFKWKKISPLSGIKRIFSPSGVWELAKNLLRLMLLLGIGYESTHAIVMQILSQENSVLSNTLNKASSMLLIALRAIALGAFFLSLFDYMFQRRRYNQSMKMTKEEVKREMREQDGSPEMKRAVRRRRRRMSRLQLLSAMKESNVVVVNPTHYAVALRYDKTKDKAPMLLSKGEDEDALAIRYEAIRLRIPIVENPPLARMIYDSCNINSEISVDLYQRVAKLFAFVYSLSPTAKQLLDIHKMSYS